VVCLATAVSAFPGQIASVEGLAQSVFDYIDQTIHGRQNKAKVGYNIADFGYKALGLAAGGFARMGLSLTSCTQRITADISGVDEKPILRQMMRTLQQILLALPRDVDLNPITEKLAEILNGVQTNFLFSEVGTQIYPFLQPALFGCLEAILLTPESVTEEMAFRIASSTEPEVHMAKVISWRMLRTRAQGCAFVDDPDFVRATKAIALRQLGQINSMINRHIIFDACISLFLADRWPIEECQVLLPQLEALILSAPHPHPPCCDATAAFFSLIEMAFNFQTEAIDACLALLPPPSDSVYTVVCAQFALYAVQHWPEKVLPRLPLIAARILAARDIWMKQVPLEVARGLCEVIADADRNVLLGLLQNNQTLLLRVLENIGRFPTK
jgi:hypothetical protein